MTRPAFAPARVACLVLSIAAAALWLVASSRGLTGGVWLAAKSVTVPLLALSVWLARGRAPDAGSMALALLAHGAGDLLLELRFLAGVAAFLLGHLLYVRVFWRHRLALDDVGGGAKLAVGSLALFAAGFLAFLAPRLAGALTPAIPIYVAALTAMGGAAWWCAHGRPWVPLGATLFVISDALLGLELFAGGAPGGRALVWPLYVTGQLAIAMGWAWHADSQAGPAPPGPSGQE